jgi:hypothetical protein
MNLKYPVTYLHLGGFEGLTLLCMFYVDDESYTSRMSRAHTEHIFIRHPKVAHSNNNLPSVTYNNALTYR